MLTAALSFAVLVAIAAAALAATYATQAREAALTLRRKIAAIELLEADHEGLKAAFYKLRGYTYATNKRARDAAPQPPEPAPPDDDVDPELQVHLAFQAAPPPKG